MDAPVKIQDTIILHDAWEPLKKFTTARIAIGRAGNAIPIKTHLQFMADHAVARDAVYATIDYDKLAADLAPLNLPNMQLQSRAASVAAYLQRPDLGRMLDEASTEKLASAGSYDIAIIIADGLSASAVQQYAPPVLQELALLLKPGTSIAPLLIVKHGRVAIADEAGMLVNAKVSIILIGERPGLSSPHSMGIYITYQPSVGLTDERRNCISNIHPNGGLTFSEAARQAYALIQSAFALKISGVTLKKPGQLSY